MTPMKVNVANGENVGAVAGKASATNNINPLAMAAKNRSNMKAVAGKNSAISLAVGADGEKSEFSKILEKTGKSEKNIQGLSDISGAADQIIKQTAKNEALTTQKNVKGVGQKINLNQNAKELVDGIFKDVVGDQKTNEIRSLNKIDASTSKEFGHLMNQGTDKKLSSLLNGQVQIDPKMILDEVPQQLLKNEQPNLKMLNTQSGLSAYGKNIESESLLSKKLQAVSGLEKNNMISPLEANMVGQNANMTLQQAMFGNKQPIKPSSEIMSKHSGIKKSEQLDKKIDELQMKESSSLSSILDQSRVGVHESDSAKHKGHSQDFKSHVGGENKVIDLSNIQASNNQELITKISNYVEQAAIQNKANVEVTIKHNELGEFKINASKSGKDNSIDLSITSGNQQAHDFFIMNEPQLMKSLNDNGVKLNDFKLSMNAESFSSQMSFSQGDNGSGSKGFSQSQSESHMSQSFTRENLDQGQERRRDLWKIYQDLKDSNERLSA